MHMTCQLVALVLHAQTQDAPIPRTATPQAVLVDGAEEGLSYGHPGLPSMAPLPSPSPCSASEKIRLKLDLPGL